jgi:hypothetical protein
VVDASVTGCVASVAKSPDDAATDVGRLATLPAGTTKPNGELVQYRDGLVMPA